MKNTWAVFVLNLCLVGSPAHGFWCADLYPVREFSRKEKFLSWISRLGSVFDRRSERKVQDRRRELGVASEEIPYQTFSDIPQGILQDTSVAGRQRALWTYFEVASRRSYAAHGLVLAEAWINDLAMTFSREAVGELSELISFRLVNGHAGIQAFNDRSSGFELILGLSREVLMGDNKVPNQPDRFLTHDLFHEANRLSDSSWQVFFKDKDSYKVFVEIVKVASRKNWSPTSLESRIEREKEKGRILFNSLTEARAQIELREQLYRETREWVEPRISHPFDFDVFWFVWTHEARSSNSVFDPESIRSLDRDRWIGLALRNYELYVRKNMLEDLGTTPARFVDVAVHIYEFHSKP